MAGLPKVENVQLPTPHAGQIALAVQRHMFPMEPSLPDRRWLHEQRSKLIHDLVDDFSLEVQDWGNTDSDTPAEIAEGILISIAATALVDIAKRIASWIKERKKKVRESNGVLAVKLKRPDGVELTIRAGAGTRQSDVVAMVRSFLEEATTVGD